MTVCYIERVSVVQSPCAVRTSIPRRALSAAGLHTKKGGIMRKWWRSVAGLVIVLACLAGCSRKDEASFCYGYLAGSHQMRLCCNDEKECRQNVEQAWKQYQNTGDVEGGK